MRRSAWIAGVLLVGLAVGGADEPKLSEFAYQAEVAVPSGESPWIRFDMPPVFYQYLREGSADLRVFDATGTEIPRLVVADRGIAADRTEELSEFRRERLDDGRERVGVVLRDSGEAPVRLRLVGGAAGGGPVDLSSAVDPTAFVALAHVATPMTDGGDLLLDLPPFAGRLLRVDATAIERIEAEWGAPRPMRRVDLEARQVGRRNLRGALSLMFDLRVARAPGLEMELEVAMLTESEVTATDGPLPDGEDWRPLHVARDADAPQDRARVTIRAPEEAARRWVHVVIPCAQPEQARVVRSVARVTRQRVFVARAGLAGPLTVAVGRRSSTEPSDGLARSSASWDVGDPTTVAAPPWQPAIGPGLRGASGDGLPKGRPFPWAEVIATLLMSALAAWWMVLRRPRAVGTS